FFHHPATTQISTLSLHDALPISARVRDARCTIWSQRNDPVTDLLLAGASAVVEGADILVRGPGRDPGSRRTRRAFYAEADLVRRDRKSTRLNSSHVAISYAVFCL